jgi:predicted transcriptional regulator
MINFSRVFKRQLLLKNINVHELSKRTKLGERYLYQLMNGERRWNETYINKVCKALELEFEIKERKEGV